MGKTFRKDSSHNKYNRRDRDAKEKFSKKFNAPKRPHPKSVDTDIVEPPVPEEY